MEATRRWYMRLFALFPDLTFDIKQVLVRGWPWETVVTIEWTDRATARDGQPYANEGVHVMHLRWGRVVRFRVYTDTQRIVETCRRLGQHGVGDALAAPIVD